jgi:hypothetical protein
MSRIFALTLYLIAAPAAAAPACPNETATWVNTTNKDAVLRVVGSHNGLGVIVGGKEIDRVYVQTSTNGVNTYLIRSTDDDNELDFLDDGTTITSADIAAQDGPKAGGLAPTWTRTCP